MFVSTATASRLLDEAVSTCVVALLTVISCWRFASPSTSLAGVGDREPTRTRDVADLKPS